MTSKRSSRTVLWLLLAAALFMRAFLPQGYMPERTESGAITVRVCGSGHVLQIPTGKDEAPNKSERAEPPFALREQTPRHLRAGPRPDGERQLLASTAMLQQGRVR